jgi:serine/threonine-protein phosphatase 2B catalytic subunit
MPSGLYSSKYKMEPMLDPLNDRFIKDLPPPPRRSLSRDLLFPSGSIMPDWALVRSHLQQEGRIDKPECVEIITLATQVLRNEGNLLELLDPVTIVGDIHGQFFDLLRILELGGSFENTKYLFLGDYVDRGAFSVEVVLLLYSIKLNYPKNVFLLRGNHECRQMTSFFNFRSECLYKYDTEVYDLIMHSFDALPVSCIVNNKFIAVHGGISPELNSLQDIANLNRNSEPPRSGLFCDLLWSDPIDNDAGNCAEKFKANEVRGCSYYYGSVAVNSFLKKNKLLSVLRAHEAQPDGYKMHKWNGSAGFPIIITIFSAPNYCDVYNNKGAIVKFNNNVLNIQQYNYTVHPYILPNFMDIFTWSIPFVIEKVLEILNTIIKTNEEFSNLEEEEEEEEEEEKNKHDEAQRPLTIKYQSAKAQMLRKKVRAVTKMMMMLKTLRNEKEIILQLKGLCPDNKIPRGLLSQGREAIIGAVDAFQKAKQWDLTNEKRPE